MLKLVTKEESLLTKYVFYARITVRHVKVLSLNAHLVIKALFGTLISLACQNAQVVTLETLGQMNVKYANLLVKIAKILKRNVPLAKTLCICIKPLASAYVLKKYPSQ